MCGIAGIAANNFDRSVIPMMLNAMRHRGPDDEGCFISKGVHLGHCRLAINDISEKARQPFVSEDRSVAVAVNGEIYNYNVLKGPLQKNGCRFQSRSDSEIVLHAYMEYGLDFIPRLNGMFAISIWDDKKKELFLIRDRLGIKPLYYARMNDGLVFASEIKALAQLKDLDLALDMQSFAEYLVFENYFSNRTLNKNIKMVEPGQMIRFSLCDNLTQEYCFWQPDFASKESPQKTDVYAHYLNITEAAVNRHLISDVPLGSYLSSGIDSSSVVYWTTRKMGSGLRTYSGFFQKGGFYDEATQAKETANNFGCIHNTVEISPADFIKYIKKILWHLDEPKVGMGVFSQYMVAQRAAQDVKVILTGHGQDELFAGYPVFKAIYGKRKFLQLLGKTSAREWLFFIYFSLYPLIKQEAGYYLPNIFSLRNLKEILNAGFYDNLIHQTNIFEELQKLRFKYQDEYRGLMLTYLKYYLPALFVVEDKISMAHSLESRTPLCDNEIIDFALSLPLAQKLYGCELKHIPRTSMKGKLPEALFRLPKRGFPTPLRLWFKKELKDYIRDFICDQLTIIPMFKKEEVAKIVCRYQRSQINSEFDEIAAHKIWIFLNLISYFTNQKERYTKLSLH